MMPLKVCKPAFVSLRVTGYQFVKSVLHDSKAAAGSTAGLHVARENVGKKISQLSRNIMQLSST